MTSRHPTPDYANETAMNTDDEEQAMARPSEFSQETADAICEKLSEGQSLRAICEDDALPSRESVRRWLIANEAFRGQYARAREVQADTLFDEMLDIADDARNDWMERDGEDDRGWVVNGENIQRSKLRIDARKWMAGKLKPKVYGEKVDVTHGGDPDRPIISRVENVIVDVANPHS